MPETGLKMIKIKDLVTAFKSNYEEVGMKILSQILNAKRVVSQFPIKNIRTMNLFNASSVDVSGFNLNSVKGQFGD